MRPPGISLELHINGELPKAHLRLELTATSGEINIYVCILSRGQSHRPEARLMLLSMGGCQSGYTKAERASRSERRGVKSVERGPKALTILLRFLRSPSSNTLRRTVRIR